MAPLLSEEEAALDPYTLLGLDKSTAGGGMTEQVIKKAFRKMSLKYHPDKVCPLPPEFKPLPVPTATYHSNTTTD
jgi:preprotein translocase subunit Sec63